MDKESGQKFCERYRRTENNVRTREMDKEKNTKIK